MEEGRLTDNVGRIIDFKNTVIIMTTNSDSPAGQYKLMITPDVLRADTGLDNEQLVRQQLEHKFRPEFLNRIDDIIIFKTLGVKELENVVDLELGKIEARLAAAKVRFLLSDEAKRFLIGKIVENRYGARSVKRLLQKWIENPLAEEMINRLSHTLNTIMITLGNKEKEQELLFSFVSRLVYKMEEDAQQSTQTMPRMSTCYFVKSLAQMERLKAVEPISLREGSA